MECTFLSSFCSFSVSIASLFSPTSHLPPFFFLSLSLLLQSIHFPIFFLRCPDLIYPFYLPPVFGAISPPLRLSLILVSPGFLSPGEEGKRFLEETSSVRRSPMTHVHTNAFHSAPDGHMAFSFQKRFIFFYAYLSLTVIIPLRHSIAAVNARGQIPQVIIMPECVARSSSTRKTHAGNTKQCLHAV